MEQVGVRVGEFALRPSAAPPAPFDDSAFHSFAVAGEQAPGEFRCADCGYGAVVQRALPTCPMCGGTVWESRGPLRP